MFFVKFNTIHIIDDSIFSNEATFVFHTHPVLTNEPWDIAIFFLHNHGDIINGFREDFPSTIWIHATFRPFILFKVLVWHPRCFVLLWIWLRLNTFWMIVIHSKKIDCIFSNELQFLFSMTP